MSAMIMDSLTHYARSKQSLLKKAPTVCRQLVSGLFHMGIRPSFHLSFTVLCSLSVTQYLRLWRWWFTIYLSLYVSCWHLWSLLTGLSPCFGTLFQEFRKNLFCTYSSISNFALYYFRFSLLISTDCIWRFPLTGSLVFLFTTGNPWSPRLFEIIRPIHLLVPRHPLKACFL